MFVTPSEVTDIEAKELARNIANRVESELKYPGGNQNYGRPGEPRHRIRTLIVAQKGHLR